MSDDSDRPLSNQLRNKLEPTLIKKGGNEVTTVLQNERLQAAGHAFLPKFAVYLAGSNWP